MAATVERTGRLTYVPVDQISPECNDRVAFDPTELQALADSIAVNGLVQPITVRPRTDGHPGFFIVAGERRWRATVLTGAASIRAFVRDIDDRQASDIMLLENLARVDLNPIEEAAAYRKRLDAGMDIVDLAKLAGVPVFRVRWRLRLLALDAEIQQLVASGVVGTQYGYAMEGLDLNRQRIAVAALKSNPTAGEFEALCARLLNDQRQDGLFPLDGFLQVAEYVAQAKRDNINVTMVEAVKLGADIVDGLMAILPEGVDLPTELADQIARLRRIDDARKAGKLGKRGPKSDVTSIRTIIQ